MLAQRRPGGGDHIRDVRLPGGDRVEVALHQYRVLHLVNRLVEGRLRRIQVLRLGGVIDHPPAKSDQFAMIVVDRDDDPLAEPVPQLPSPVGLYRQPGLHHLAVGRAVLAQEPDHVVLALPRRREAELELGHGPTRDPTRLELDQGALPGRVLQQDVMEVLGGQQIQLRDRPFELALPTGARRFLEDDPGLLREQPQGAAKVDVLDVLDEGEVVAALLTAVAMPELLFRRYI